MSEENHVSTLNIHANTLHSLMAHYITLVYGVSFNDRAKIPSMPIPDPDKFVGVIAIIMEEAGKVFRPKMTVKEICEAILKIENISMESNEF